MTDNPRLDELRRRVQADPTSIAFAALAEEYRRAGLCAEAVDVCRTGLTRHPQYLSARVTLGRALIELNELDEARMELEQVLSVAPENLAAIRGLAEIHARRGSRPPSAPGAPSPGTPASARTPEIPAPVPPAPFELDLLPAATPRAPLRLVTENQVVPELAALSRFLDAVLDLKSRAS